MPVGRAPAAVLEAQTSPKRQAKKMKNAMSNVSGLPRSHERWARFRFSVIGPLLAQVSQFLTENEIAKDLLF
jgi:hypothetical protein